MKGKAKCKFCFKQPVRTRVAPMRPFFMIRSLEAAVYFFEEMIWRSNQFTGGIKTSRNKNQWRAWLIKFDSVTLKKGKALMTIRALNQKSNKARSAGGRAFASISCPISKLFLTRCSRIGFFFVAASSISTRLSCSNCKTNIFDVFILL